MATKILLVGYGAVGFVYAFLLEKTGKAEVTVVAGSNYAEASEGRLNFKSEQYGEVQGFRPSRVKKSVEDAADQAYDFVLVTTKAVPELNPTSALLAPLLSTSYAYSQPTYILVQNGIGIEKDLSAVLLERDERVSTRIVTTALYVSAWTTEGVVHHGRYSRLIIGMDEEVISPDDQKALDAFVLLAREGGSETTISDNIQAVKFKKNMWNACFATISSLTRMSCSAFYANAAVKASMEPFMLSVSLELIAVGKALGYKGISLDEGPAEFLRNNEEIHVPGGYNVDVKASMLLDVERGKPFELEVIVGEVVRAGKRLGVYIPLLEACYAMLLVVQNQYITAAGT